MDLKTIRKNAAVSRMDGFAGLTTKPDGSEMFPAYVVLCSSAHMPYNTSGFIGVEHYMPGSAMDGEIGCVESTRFILDESVTTPVFLKDVAEYQLYPATRDK